MIGRSNVREDAVIKAALGTPYVGAALLAFGALCPIGASLTGICPIRESLAYASTAALTVTALGMVFGWTWARLAGRVVAWANVFLFAMLVVPDWDDAMASGAQGLHTVCGVLAAYFLLCAISLGFGRQGRTNPS
jgi:hypothetical protein